MIIVILVLSLIGLAVSLLMPAYSDFLFVAGPCVVACYWILWQQRIRPQHDDAPRRKKPARVAAHVIIDGSNVMHWQEGAPRLQTVREVLSIVTAKGLTPTVIFDANAGYKISDRYQGGRSLARQLFLRDNAVFVVPKGTPADVHILDTARRMKARVISADRYRDWAEAYPEVVKHGFLIRGGVQDGKVWLAEFSHVDADSALPPPPLVPTPLPGPSGGAPPA
jgi:Zc3h12a-like Ribonuclease NYN domain